MLRKEKWMVVILGAIWLMATLASATQEMIESPGNLTLQLSKEPRLGETVTLTATFTANKDNDHLRVEFHTPKGTKIAGGQSLLETQIGKGETKSFVVQVKFISVPAEVNCRVHKIIKIKGKDGKEKEYKLETAGKFIWRVLVDQKTGQLGTEEERKQRLAADYPEKIDYPLGIQYGTSPQNRNLIQLFLRDEPQLTKLEALWLADKAEQNYAKNPWAHETAQSAKERDPDGTPSVFRRAVERVIDEAKLKSKQTGRAKIAVYREMIEEWKKVRKPDQPMDEGFLQMSPGKKDSLPRVKGDYPLAVTGRFYYKKHAVDTFGLRETVTSTPLRKALVRIYDNAPGSPTYLGQTFTNSNGNYSLSVGLDTTYLYHGVYPVVCATGPTSSGQDAYRVFAVSDTVTQFPSMSGGMQKVWRYHLTAQVMPWWQGSWDFGDSCFAEHALYPTVHQPKSGAASIYDAILKAYEYMTNGYTNGSTLTSVRAVWEPGYLTPYNKTFYRGDSIYVCGDELYYGTDEWDDHSLLHEYGHHILKKCAEMPPDTLSSWQWHQSYPNSHNAAYGEGWSDYYHHNTSLTVTDYKINTLYGIAESTAFWWNVENPWNSCSFIPDSFKGGPWCPGAVVGVLHDIYDAFNADESPYPSYPYPSWPDTGLADSIAQGFSPSWDITDNYKIDNHNVYTIYEFLSGWMHPPAHPNSSYGDIGWLNKVLKHHRISWNRPDAPENLTATGVCTDGPHMELNWDSVSGVIGYNVYRTVDDMPYSYSRRNYELITGTSYWDNESQYTLYRYSVTSVDSLGNESDFSETVSQSYNCNSTDRGSQFGGAVALIPHEFDLSQNVPNPFSGGTAIRYALPRDVHAALRVYDIQGRLVRTLIDADLKAAYHQVNWDLKSDNGVELPAGVYFIRMEAGDFRKTRKLVVVR